MTSRIICNGVIMRFRKASTINLGLFFIFWVPISLLVGCDKGEDEEEAVASLEVSYSLIPGYEYSVMRDDTVEVTLGDTLTVYVAGQYIGDFSGIWSDEEVDVTGNENQEYTCVPVRSGLFSIGAYAEGEDGSFLSVTFLVNVSSLNYKMVISAEPIITIEADDAATGDSIRAELEDSGLLPVKYTEYNLKCNTAKGGELAGVTASSVVISGTFTSSDVFKMTDLVLRYDGLEYDFTLDRIEADEAGFSYWLEQDLTAIFKDRYPAVNKVLVKTRAINLPGTRS